MHSYNGICPSSYIFGLIAHTNFQYIYGCFRVYEAVRKVFGGKGEDFVVQQFGVEEQFGVDVPSFVL